MTAWEKKNVMQVIEAAPAPAAAAAAAAAHEPFVHFVYGKISFGENYL